MKKISLRRFLILEIFYTFVQGFVHPITPTIYKNLNFPDYVFGVESAATATGMFIFSPFWGRWGDKIGHSKAFSLALPIYAVSQLVFGLSKTPLKIIIARFFSGLSGGGAMVVSMAYIVNSTNSENRGRIMSYFVALNTIAKSMGYFIGGVLGNISISAVFIIQITGLCLIALLTHIFVEDPDILEVNYTYSNPFYFKDQIESMKTIMSKSLILVLIIVFFANIALCSYESALNYYIKADLDLPSTYNGIIKAITGIVGLLVNVTINIYIVKNTNMKKSMIIVLILCGAFSILAPFVSNLNMFFLCNIIYYMFNSIYLPIEQVVVMENAKERASGVISGLFNSVKSISMIVGSLSVGFLYSIKSKIPFIMVSIMFLLAAIVSVINYFYSKKVKSN